MLAHKECWPQTVRNDIMNVITSLDSSNSYPKMTIFVIETEGTFDVMKGHEHVECDRTDRYTDSD